MNDKNEPVIEIAKNIIDDCNSFEIKNLDTDKSCSENSFDIITCADFINDYLNSFEEEQNQNLIQTGNKDLDKLCIFEKGMFKLFCTDDFNVPLTRMVNSFVFKAINTGKRVLVISPYSNVNVRNFLKAVGQNRRQGDLSWFDDKKLYFCDCMPDDNIDNIIDLTENIKSKFSDLNIDIVYIPYLEDLLQNYCADLQINALKHLYNFAFDTKICIVSTLSPFDYYECKNDDSLFYPQYKLDVSVLKKILPSEAMYITSFSGNIANFENWSVWDYINDTPSKVFVQSFDDFYTFDSISMDTN